MRLKAILRDSWTRVREEDRGVQLSVRKRHDRLNKYITIDSFTACPMVHRRRYWMLDREYAGILSIKEREGGKFKLTRWDDEDRVR